MALYRFNFGSEDKSLFDSGGSADFSLYSRSGVADSGGAKTKFAGIRVTGSSFLGDAAGDTTTICGNLVVTGNTTTINSTTLQVDDKNIELGTVDTPTDTTADGGGITLKGATDKTILWTNSTDAWHFNQNICVTSGAINVGSAGVASAHFNTPEMMSFNIDTDNNATNKCFSFATNSASNSGTKLLTILESGNVGIGTTAP